jgi:hypothetical protein
VNLGATALTTTYVSAGQLTASVAAPLIATSTTAWITVNNPGTPNRVSNIVFLSVGSPTTSLNYATQSLTAGTGALGVAYADFNGDGKMDLVVANYEAASITTFLGNADGTFQTGVATAITGAYPVGIVVGDFNGDGKADVAFGDDDSDYMYVLLGNGDGTFQTPVQLSTPNYANDELVVGDFNNDGNLDIIAEEDGGGSLTLLLGNGDGTFQAATAIPTSTGGLYLHEADLRGNGNLDLVLPGYNGGVYVMLGNGDGTFQSSVDYTAGTDSVDAAIADFNGDGKLDIVASSQSDDNVYVLLGNGDGTFQTAQAQAVGSSSWAITAADLNADGNMDIAWTTEEGGIVGVALGNGDGTFQTPITFPGPSFGYAITTASFGTGGGLGIASTDITSDLAYVLEPTVILSPSTFNFGSQSVGVATAAQTFTLTNSTSSSINISGISVLGTNANDFADTTNCGAALASAASCTIQVTFTPDSAAALSGTLTVIDTAAGGSQTASLTGTGIAASIATANLSSSALTFSGQVVGTTSAAQSVTLTNNGSVALTVASIAVSGTNAGDFKVTNNCGASVIGGANCAIGATFKPTAGGARSATITITDSATSGTQTITLQGTAEDFSMAFTGGSTIASGLSENLTLTVTPQGGFTGTVALTCSGAPALSTCTVSPTSVTLNGSAAATATFTLSTGQTTSNLPSAPPAKFPPAALRWGSLFAALLTLAMMVLGLKAPQGRTLRPAALSFGVLLLLVSVGMSACVGVTKHETIPTTPPGTYTLTATGTSGSLTNTATVGITVSK